GRRHGGPPSAAPAASCTGRQPDLSEVHPGTIKEAAAHSGGPQGDPGAHPRSYTGGWRTPDAVHRRGPVGGGGARGARGGAGAGWRGAGGGGRGAGGGAGGRGWAGAGGGGGGGGRGGRGCGWGDDGAPDRGRPVRGSRRRHPRAASADATLLDPVLLEVVDPVVDAQAVDGPDPHVVTSLADGGGEDGRLLAPVVERGLQLGEGAPGGLGARGLVARQVPVTGGRASRNGLQRLVTGAASGTHTMVE